MKKTFFFTLFFLLTGMIGRAQTVQTKTIDNGGTGMFKAKNFEGNVKVETQWILNGDRHIYGKLATPLSSSEGKKRGIVIVSHGFNGTHHFAESYFEPLARLGYAVYAFDFPCGSVHSMSDPNTMEMSILDEQSDLRAIVNYFRQQPWVDTSRIVLIGESQGGLVSALTAAQLKSQISKLILVYPALCIPDNWRARYPKLSDIPEETDLWGVRMGSRFFREIHDMQPLKLIKSYRGPVFIIQGDKDAIVSMEDSKKAVTLYKDASLYIIPGAGHGFNPRERAESIGKIKTFIMWGNGGGIPY